MVVIFAAVCAVCFDTMCACLYVVREQLKVRAFLRAPRLAGNLSRTRLVSVGHRCSRPFWRRYFSPAPLPSRPADWTNTRPTCHRWPNNTKTRIYQSTVVGEYGGHWFRPVSITWTIFVISWISITPLPSTSYIRKAHLSFSSGVPLDVTSMANRNS